MKEDDILLRRRELITLWTTTVYVYRIYRIQNTGYSKQEKINRMQDAVYIEYIGYRIQDKVNKKRYTGYMIQ